jgi:hypothetical protein
VADERSDARVLERALFEIMQEQLAAPAALNGVPRALIAVVAAKTLGGGAEVVGYLYASPFAGGLGASLSSGRMGRVRRQGVAVVLAAGAWVAAIVVFGFAESLFLALALLALARPPPP